MGRCELGRPPGLRRQTEVTAAALTTTLCLCCLLEDPRAFAYIPVGPTFSPLNARRNPCEAHIRIPPANPPSSIRFHGRFPYCVSSSVWFWRVARKTISQLHHLHWSNSCSHLKLERFGPTDTAGTTTAPPTWNNMATRCGNRPAPGHRAHAIGGSPRYNDRRLFHGRATDPRVDVTVTRRPLVLP